MKPILTLKEARKKEVLCCSFPNGDYRYKLKGEKYYHLIRNGKNLLEGLKAVDCYSCLNGDYWYKLKGEEYFHLIRNGKNLLEGLKAVDCYSFPNGDVEYEDEQGKLHTIKNTVIK